MICGLVIHLAQNAAFARSARAALDRRADIDVGQMIGNRLPIVVESSGQQEAETTTQWLRELTGVVHVDVTFVHLDDAPPPTTPSRQAEAATRLDRSP